MERDGHPSTAPPTLQAAEKPLEDSSDERTLNDIELHQLKVEHLYARYSDARKHAIVAVAAFSALLVPFASTSFFPALPQIALDLNTTESIIGYTVLVYLIFVGIAPLLWAPYAVEYGRRPIFLISLPMFAVASLGVGFSKTLPQLIATRMLQSCGTSSVLSVGAGCIGDLYPPSKRGRATGIFYTSILLGPSISPVLAGGLLQAFPDSSLGWRSMQWILAGMGFLAFAFIVFFLPETSHRLALAAESGLPQPPKRKFLNPLKPVKLLRFPNIAMVTIASSATLSAFYFVVTPISTVLVPRYGLQDHPALAGCLFLAPGLGQIVGSKLGGHNSDRVLRRWREKRGHYVPEDRLRASLLCFWTLYPLSILGNGLVIQFMDSKAGLALSLIFMFLAGFGMMIILNSANTYCIDCKQDRSVEVIAVNNLWRYLCSGAATGACLPLYLAIGAAGASAIAAGICWIGALSVLLGAKKGTGWREGADRAEEARKLEKAAARSPAADDSSEKAPSPTETEPIPPQEPPRVLPV